MSALIASVTQEKEAVVTTLDETRHGLEDGDFVTFAEVQGMTQLNGCEAVKVKVLGRFLFFYFTPLFISDSKILEFIFFPTKIKKRALHFLHCC